MTPPLRAFIKGVGDGGGDITCSYEEMNSKVFYYVMYTTAKSSILHMTISYEELNSLLLYVIGRIELFAVVYIA